MEGEEKVPDNQGVKAEVGDVGQTSEQAPQRPAPDSQLPPESTSPEKPKKRSKTKKIVIGLALLIVLIILGYAGYLAFTYWNCTKTTPKVCETNKCNFSLTGFSLQTEKQENCCGNTKCEVGETFSDCSTDCPSCDDKSECTVDSYDYDKGECVHEQTVFPCNVRQISLSPATSENNFQVRVELSSTNFDYSKAMTNGEDIRFFDEDSNLLDYWIEEWNKEGVSTIWVKVTDLATDKINMYYGYPGSDSASEGSKVFEFFEDFDYESESELTKVWGKYRSPTIELSGGIITITSLQDEGQQAQHIFKSVGSSVLLNNIVEINAKRFSEYQSHMANIGYTSSVGGPISDGDTWAALRHSPSPDGSYVVFGGNHGSITSSPVGSFNTIKIYHQAGASNAYEPSDTKVAQYVWPSEPPAGDYVLLGGATNSGSGKASYNWIRVRKYSSKEPSASVGDEQLASEDSGIKELYSK